MPRKKKEIQKTEENQVLESKVEQYIVYDPDDNIVLSTEDIFKALDKLKLQSPKAKMTRASDGKTLAFTTAPRPEDAWVYGLQ